MPPACRPSTLPAAGAARIRKDCNGLILIDASVSRDVRRDRRRRAWAGESFDSSTRPPGGATSPLLGASLRRALFQRVVASRGLAVVKPPRGAASPAGLQVGGGGGGGGVVGCASCTVTAAAGGDAAPLSVVASNPSLLSGTGWGSDGAPSSMLGRFRHALRLSALVAAAVRAEDVWVCHDMSIESLLLGQSSILPSASRTMVGAAHMVCSSWMASCSVRMARFAGSSSPSAVLALIGESTDRRSCFSAIASTADGWTPAISPRWPGTGEPATKAQPHSQHRGTTHISTSKLGLPPTSTTRPLCMSHPLWRRRTHTHIVQSPGRMRHRCQGTRTSRIDPQGSSGIVGLHPVRGLPSQARPSTCLLLKSGEDTSTIHAGRLPRRNTHHGETVSQV